MPSGLELLINIRTQGGSEMDQLRRATGGMAQEALQASRVVGNFEANIRNISKTTADTKRGIESLAASIRSGVQDPFGAAGRAAERLVLRFGTLGIAAAGIAAAAAVASKQLFDMARVTGQLAEQELLLAERTGLTVREVGLYSAASKIAGVNVESFVVAVRTLSEALSEGTEEGQRGKRALTQLGIEATNLNGQIKPVGQLFFEIADALNRIPQPTERARIAVSIFGRGALELLPLLRGNFRELITEVERMGVIFTDSGVRTAARFDDALDRLGLKARKVSRDIGLAVAETADAFGLLGPKTPLEETHIGTRVVGPPLPPGGGVGTILKALDERDKSKRAQELFESLQGPQESIRRLQAERQAILKSILTATEAQQGNLAEEARVIDGKIKQVERILEAQRDAHTKLAQAQARTAALLNQFRPQPKTEIGRFDQQVADALQELRGFPDLANQVTARAAETRQAMVKEIIAKSIASGKEMAKEAVEKLEKAPDKTPEQIAREVMERAKQSLESQNKIIDAFRKAERDRDIDRLRALEDYQNRRDELLAGPGGDVRVAQEQHARRLRFIDIELERRLAAAAMVLDAEERLIAVEEARHRAGLEFQQAQHNFELRLLEMQQQKLQEFRDIAGRVFDALVAGGQTSLRDLFRGMMLTQLRTIFVNVAAEAFKGLGGVLGGAIGGQRDPQSGKLTPLGRILQGTVLGIENKELAEATRNSTASQQQLKSSTDNLKGSVDRLTATISGAASGAVGGGGLQGAVEGVKEALDEVSDPSAATSAKQRSRAGQVLGDIGGLAAGVAGIILGGKAGAPGLAALAAGPLIGQSLENLITQLGGNKGVAHRVGQAGIIAGGAFGVISGIKEGGTRGTLHAVSSAAATAAALDPEPISKAILAAIAVTTDIVASFVGPNVEKRKREIAAALERNRYADPSSQDLLVDLYGRQMDRDVAGTFRMLPPPIPGIGGFGTDFGGGIFSDMGNHMIIVNVDTMDAKSFLDNRGRIAEAVRRSIIDGHPLQAELDSMSSRI